MTDKEYPIISLTREATLDFLDGTGWKVKDGLSEQEMQAIADRYTDYLDNLSACSDLFIDAVRDTVGDRLQEDN